jgi:hypothetical protein
MEHARQGGTAALLNDGRVLVAHGRSSSDPNETELFDESEGSFIPVGYSVDVRQFTTTTLLADGRVMMTGGSTAWVTGPDTYYDATPIYAP